MAVIASYAILSCSPYLVIGCLDALKFEHGHSDNGNPLSVFGVVTKLVTIEKHVFLLHC